jgi:hypothetical protein
MTTMQRRFRYPATTRVGPLGLAAAAGALGLAATIAAAGAPTARADAFTDIINGVEDDFAYGQASFSDAFAELGSGDVGNGLAAFFSGVDDDLVGAPDSLYIGGVDALTNEPVLGSFSFDLVFPGDFTAALTEVQSFVSIGEGYLTSAATEFAAGDFADAASNSALGSDYLFDIDPQILLMGAVDSLGF